MQHISTAKKFDDRAIDFLSGRKISPPMADRRLCDCCGQRIVKGFFTNLGTIGEDCREVIRRAEWMASIDEYIEDQRRIGWGVKPAVRRFLAEVVYQ